MKVNKQLKYLDNMLLGSNNKYPKKALKDLMSFKLL